MTTTKQTKTKLYDNSEIEAIESFDLQGYLNELNDAKDEIAKIYNVVHDLRGATSGAINTVKDKDGGEGFYEDFRFMDKKVEVWEEATVNEKKDIDECTEEARELKKNNTGGGDEEDKNKIKRRTQDFSDIDGGKTEAQVQGNDAEDGEDEGQDQITDELTILENTISELATILIHNHKMLQSLVAVIQESWRCEHEQKLISRAVSEMKFLPQVTKIDLSQKLVKYFE
ncbi:MAG: hypothetical protein P1V18_01150 [Candidatus Gracilibacteria bacterium]|nr:hypothetical protein [Candidatus Gracilibacteria bacterium]